MRARHARAARAVRRARRSATAPTSSAWRGASSTQRGPLRVERRYQKPPGIEWDDETYQGDAYPCFSYAAVAVEVEVDLDTGEVRVLKVTTAQDIGKAIHPVLCAGQIEGGTLQGLGYALLEEVRWKDGRVWNHQLTNYIIPTFVDAPPMDVILVENPFPGGPFGAKGVGELPMDVPAGAVVAAIAPRHRRAARRHPGHAGAAAARAGGGGDAMSPKRTVSFTVNGEAAARDACRR